MSQRLSSSLHPINIYQLNTPQKSKSLIMPRVQYVSYPEPDDLHSSRTSPQLNGNPTSFQHGCLQMAPRWSPSSENRRSTTSYFLPRVRNVLSKPIRATPTTFHSFTKLPTELREIIWILASEAPAVLFIDEDDLDREKRTQP